VAPAASQDQPPGAANAQEGPRQVLPGPCEDLPSGVIGGSELQQSEQYQGQEHFCGDDVVSNIICRPAAKYTPQMAKAMCQSFRDGHLPNFKISLSEGPVSVDVSSIQEYCDHFFPLLGIACRSNTGSCELQAPALVGSDCECNTVQFGTVPGKVVN
jgi:hypothetical protein